MIGMKRKLINDYKMNPCYVIIIIIFFIQDRNSTLRVCGG